MCPGICLPASSPLIPYGGNTKGIANCNQMKSTARFDLLTSFCQGNHSIDEWYNAIQAQVNLARYPPETAKILHRDIFWFFLRDEDFVSRTISDGSVKLDKFPVSRVRQLAKKLRELKSHSETHKASIWRAPGSPNQFTASPEDRATSTQIQKEKVSCKTQTG